MPAIDVNHLQAKSHQTPDELRTPPKTRIEIVRLDGVTLSRMSFQPGWVWSECIKPVAGTASCQVSHAGYAISGKLGVRMSDGTTGTVEAGQSYTIPPGHDAWVEGSEPFVNIEVLNAAAEEYGVPSRLRMLRAPGKKRVTLAFNDAALEEEFARESAPIRLRNLRTGLAMSLVLWSLVGLIVLLMGGEQRNAGAFIALGLMCPLQVMGLLVNRAGPNMRRQQFSGAVVNAAAGLGGIGLALVLGYFDRFALLVVMTMTLAVVSFVGLRFIYALAAVGSYTVFYVVIALSRGGAPIFLGLDMVIATTAFIGAGTAAYFLEVATREAFHERRKSERLLLNILPESIAERLKEDDKTLADGFESATVLFADLVGFTTLSTTMPPEKLVDMLNELFSAFDDLASRHQLEKIKTIGDAYMVAGGVPLLRRDHAKAVVAMGLDMLDTVARFSERRGVALNVRVGVHTGSVVAGVIGKKKFIYDLWGDTVNTASRMESHGLPGKVHVSEETWAQVQDRFDAEDRGIIDVKGKGKMRTYLVTGARKPG